MSNHKLILASGALAVAVLAAVASTDEDEATLVDDESDGGSGEDADEGAPQEFGVGDVVELGDWHVRVHGVTDPYEGTNGFLEPDPGNRWVSVDVEVTNNGDGAEVVSSLACFEIMDDQNQSYSQTITGETGVESPDGEVPVDGSRRGTIEYEVPDDAGGLQLNFNCDLFSRGTATITLDG